jgi:hypothetical protein
MIGQSVSLDNWSIGQLANQNNSLKGQNKTNCGLTPWCSSANQSLLCLKIVCVKKMVYTDQTPTYIKAIEPYLFSEVSSNLKVYDDA